MCTIRVSTIAKIFDPVYLSDEYSSFTDPFSVLVYIYLQGTDVPHPHGHLSHMKKQGLQRVYPEHHFAEARRCEVFFEKQDCLVRLEVDLDDVRG